MLNIILFVAVGYFAILGVIQVVLLLIRAFSHAPSPESGMLYLWAGEDPETAECRLLYYYQAIRNDDSLEHVPLAVALPQNPEARRISELFCRDHGLAMADLLPAEESIIIER